jgi:glycosyltransferase involved in cell wall biosynthesis
VKSVAFICNEYPPLPHGGIGTFVKTISEEFARRGVRVVIVGLSEKAFNHNKDFITVRISRKSKVPRVSWLFDRYRLYNSVLGLKRVEIVEVPEFGGWMPFKIPQRVVVRLHLADTVIKQKLGQKSNKLVKALEKATLCGRPWIAVSDYARKITTETFGISSKHVRTIFNPVDVPNLNNIIKRDGILFAGCISKRKGAIAAAHALKIAYERGVDAPMIFAGHTENQAIVKEIKDIIGNKFLHKVSFTGRCKHEEVLTLMQGARIFLFPSTLETFGLTVYEAMAAGAAVITSYREPFTELIENKVHACLVDPNDIAAIAEALINLTSNSKESLRLALNGRRLVQVKLTPKVCGEETLDFYDRILRGI